MESTAAGPWTNFLYRFVHRPQRLWARRLNFQVHLWVGIILSLYMILIGVTGSILVFRAELEILTSRNPWHHLVVTEPFVDIPTVVSNVTAANARAQILSVLTPTERDPTFVALIQTGGLSRRQFAVAVDPTTGKVLGELPRNDSWLNFIQRLHVNLLLGRIGRQANGVAAVFLMLLNLTGLVIWWPGITNWTRALKVDLRRNWRRINFDLHRAIGFWTIGLVSIWAVSGIYFAWSGQIFVLVNRISPIKSARPPAVTVVPQRAAGIDLQAAISQAYLLDPRTQLKEVAFPFNRRAPLRIIMRRREGPGYEYTDTLFFDPYDGRHLAIWRYGVNESLGDWLIWSQIPLHFGTYWGLSVKIVWALLGLAIPVLTVTGMLMYWNRWLGRKWKHLRRSGRQSAPHTFSIGESAR
jgi:uncharacterized iron-regulated membrane protein